MSLYELEPETDQELLDRGYIQFWQSRPEVCQVWGYPAMEPGRFWLYQGRLTPPPGCPGSHSFTLGRTFFASKNEAVQIEADRWSQHIDKLNRDIALAKESIKIAKEARGKLLAMIDP